MSNPSSISDIAAKARALGASGLTKTYDEPLCPMLPNADGTGYGLTCKIKKLNVQEQLDLLGRVRAGVAADQKRRQESDSTAPLSDDDSAEFWESIYLLELGCMVPSFDVATATQWMTLDEVDGINCADVVQFLLFRIRTLNEAAPGMEDVAGGLLTLKRFPAALQTIETAYEKGGNSLDLLLEGKTPGSKEEMSAFIDKWGDIISLVVMRSIRKRAKIEAEVSAEVLLDKVVQLLLKLGLLEEE